MIDSLNKCYHNEKILVVDTLSSQEYYNWLQTELKNKYEGIEICQTPYKGYDTGAYIYAYRNYVENYYIFLQDSIIFKDKNLIQNLIECIDDASVGCLVGFGSGGVNHGYDTKVDENFIREHFGEVAFKDGIFGPMFAVQRNVLQKLEDANQLIIPFSKNEQRAMERGWSVAFNMHNINVKALGRFRPQAYWSGDGDYGSFIKIFASINHTRKLRQ
jgi:hypothetical protein